MEDKRLVQAEQLIAWLAQEMKYVARNRPLPSVQDMKRLCRGNTMQIWAFVLEHIRSVKYDFCFLTQRRRECENLIGISTSTFKEPLRK